MLKLHNKKFGRLTAIKQLDLDKDKHFIWLFKCDCGTLKTLKGHLVASGHTSSCGCLQKERTSQASRKDYVGQKYGYLTAIKRVRTQESGLSIWLFKCDCGEKKELLSAQVKFGRIKSCGCRIGEKRKPCEERLRNIWRSMLRRTLYPHKDYSDRGITVCERWKSYKNFRDDLLSSYVEHSNKFGEGDTTLDRINNNGNYKPDNVRWATMKQQANNRRSSKLVSVVD